MTDFDWVSTVICKKETLLFYLHSKYKTFYLQESKFLSIIYQFFMLAGPEYKFDYFCKSKTIQPYENYFKILYFSFMPMLVLFLHKSPPGFPFKGGWVMETWQIGFGS